MYRAYLYFKQMRAKHWIKNILIYVPTVFARKFWEPGNQKILFFGWLSFCFMASFVYIINDLKDINEDKEHLAKRYRPLASGRIKKAEAYMLLFLCLNISIIIQFSIIKKLSAIAYMFAYIILNLGYSFGIKNIPIIDIIILASGYVIRIFYGADLSDIKNSRWLILTIIAISFYMGFGKRRNEFSEKEQVGITRKVLDLYNYNFLDKVTYTFFTLSIAFYSLWAEEYKNEIMIWTVPAVIALGLRYNYKIEMDHDGDPVEVIYKDKILLLAGCLFIFSLLVIIYM